MIHPNRTTLLFLKEKARSVRESLGILKARRQALVFEFLKTARPFLASRRKLRQRYGEAQGELAIARALEGNRVEAIAAVNARHVPLTVTEKNLFGVRYREISTTEPIRLTVEERNYDFYPTTPHVEEAVDRFEELAEAMLELAAFEQKVQRLGEAIVTVSRKTRVLEERVQPRLQREMKDVAMYLAEREREEYFRLKRFKTRTNFW